MRISSLILFLTVYAIGFLVLPVLSFGAVDIEVTLFSAPAVADPGEPIGDQIILQIRNNGPDDISDGFSVGFYISTDDQITLSDRLLLGGREFATPLAAGQEIEVPLFDGARIPDDFPLGLAFLGVIVDESNQVAESDETNNTAASPINVGDDVSTESRNWASVKLLYR